MKVYIIENRDVDDNYMNIEGVFSEEQVAINKSKIVGEPFWHDIVVSEHELKYISSNVYVVQKYDELAYAVFSTECEAKDFADCIGIGHKHISSYKVINR